MSQPPSPYERSYSFTDNSTANPTSQQPGQKIDQELNAARTAINATQSRLGEVQADDGKVRTSALNLPAIAQAVEPLLTSAPVTAVNAAGSSQVNLVNAAGATQISAVNAAAAAGQALIAAETTTPNAVTILGAEQSALAASSTAQTSAANSLINKNLAYTHYVNAGIAANEAQLAAGIAEGYAINAEDSRTAAATEANNAQNAADLANGYKTDANESKMAALQAKADAEAAANIAQSIVDDGAAAIATEVQPYLDAAAQSATDAHNSANDALTSKTQAATSATNASNSASSAATSASNASSSASSAAASATAAANSAATINPANFAAATHTHAQSDVTGLVSALASKLSDAPSNGNEYVRKNGAWSINAGGLQDAPSNSMFYARYNGSWMAFDGSTKPADSLTQDAVYAAQNAEYVSYTSSITGSISTGSGSLTFTDSSGANGKYVQLNASMGFALTDSGGFWTLDIPTFANTGNGYYAEDVATFVNGQMTSLSASSSASYYTDTTDNFVGGSVPMNKPIIGVGVGSRFILKEGLLNYFQENAINASAPLNSVAFYNGSFMQWGSPWQLEGYATSSALAGYALLTGNNSYGAKQSFSPSNSTRAGVNLGAGAAPSAPVDGDVWATTGGLYYRISSTTMEAVNVGSVQTISGNKTFTSQNLTFGNSTTAGTIGIGIGATVAAGTKTINIGTSGVNTSITNITLGSATAGAVTTITANGNINLQSGKKLTVTTAAASAGLNLAPVTFTPTTPANGDVWHNSTSSNILARVNGITEQLNSVKAWVNFNGTGTVATRASYNVSSITDNGAADYTVNFTNAMVDANYAPLISSNWNIGSNGQWAGTLGQHPTIAPTTTALRLQQTAIADFLYCSVAILR